MPLSFASNVFVQPRTMPGWLQAFVNVNPVTHLATAAITLVFAPLTLHLYSKQG